MASFRFTKTQGAGNDFLIVEGPLDLLPTPQAKQRFCDRHYGAGGDGVIFVSRAGNAAGVNASLRIFNSDGGEAEISGNGTRCAAAYLLSTAGQEKDLTVQTVAGLHEIESFRELAAGQNPKDHVPPDEWADRIGRYQIGRAHV